MDLDQLKQILELVQAHDLTEFEIEHDGLRLKIRKDSRAVAAGAFPDVPVLSAPSSAARTSTVSAAPSPTAADQSADEIELAVVKSPIVGTFYRSPEPETPPFVEIGTIVKKGQVLCIIEAMKLMNEIDSEYEGEIVNIYVENGQPVQYGERLFAIRT
ncbi:MAG: acetyl-CoA carboxylase biotin carboxyl carrier protein [Blastocatellia bacterium]|nr:MAG: acetyl-CoA carboxylase biotin carboxyl carrier protein [Blastocatellia bacterium]